MASILILEDNFETARSIKKPLELVGHTVEVVSNVRRAIEYVKQRKVDLAIVDLFIDPISDGSREGGITFISQIKQIDRIDLPVLVISGSFSANKPPHFVSSSISTTKTVGADMTLAKPINIERLITSVDILLSKK